MSRRACSAISKVYKDEDSEHSDDQSDAMSSEEEKSQHSPLSDTKSRRRGRGPSKNPCLNRNALNARENRLRKKEYLKKMENKVTYLQQQNKTLQLVVQRQGIENKKLISELNHMRAVLSNDTVIVKLLRSINGSIGSCQEAAFAERTKMGAKKGKRVPQCSESTESTESTETSLNEENTMNSYPFSQSHQDHTYTWTKGNSDLDFSSDYENDLAKKMFGDPIFSSINDSDELNLLQNFNVDSLFENLGTPDSLDLAQPGSNFFDAGYEMENENGVDPDLLPSAGICIHVNRNRVSLEFCAECQGRDNSLEEKGVDGF